MKYKLRRALTNSPERIFDLVTDVEKYAPYLPRWMVARISERDARDFAALSFPVKSC